MILPCRNPLHLYRSLLREASYLFDTTAQTYHTDHIRWSFLRQQANHKVLRRNHGDSAGLFLVSQRESRELKRARKYLCMLQRANNGHLSAVKNVLRMAYARAGRQRRLLMNDIMTPQSNNDPTVPPLPGMNSPDWNPPEKFRNLLKNQVSVQAYIMNNNNNKRKIRSVPTIPARNRWGNPFPESRIRGIMQKWYARHADLLMPPMQEKQWLEVYDAATRGTTKTTFKIPQRRPVACVNVFSTPTEQALSSDWTSEIDNLIRSSPQKPLHNRKARIAIGKPHKLKTRFLRRRMQQTVLAGSVTTNVDPDTGKLVFRRESSVKPPTAASACNESQLATLFA